MSHASCFFLSFFSKNHAKKIYKTLSLRVFVCLCSREAKANDDQTSLRVLFMAFYSAPDKAKFTNNRRKKKVFGGRCWIVNHRVSVSKNKKKQQGYIAPESSEKMFSFF